MDKICNMCGKIITQVDTPYATHEVCFCPKPEKKHTDTDMMEFAEWTSINGWIKYKDETDIWFTYVNRQKSLKTIKKTSSQLREMFEVETGRKPKP